MAMPARNPTTPDLDGLRGLLLKRGSERYDGEEVSHLDHALQAATLARRAGADDALVAAALLHDIGHLLCGLPGTPSSIGVDDRHEDVGANALTAWLPPVSIASIRLHVQAKRWLACDKTYLNVLSRDSLRSLALQGGPMTPVEREQFTATPHAASAIRLRRWDDGAKMSTMVTDDLDTFWSVVERVAGEHRRPRAGSTG